MDLNPLKQLYGWVVDKDTNDSILHKMLCLI